MKIFSRALMFLFGLALMFCVGFSFRDFERGHLTDPAAIGALVGGGTDSASRQLLNHNFQLVKTEYFRDVKPTPLRYAAITGMVASLGDPHTTFLPPREHEDFNLQTTAQLVGIGCSLLPDPRGVKLDEIFDDSPALRAGLAHNDVIIAVDGSLIKGVLRETVVSHIRGPSDTIVKLTVVKADSGKTVVVPVKRARVYTPTVTSHYFDDSKIGYLAISTFAEPTVGQFDSKLEKLRKSGLNGLIIDLRSDPGGLLDTASDLLGRFVENKTVVKMKYRDGSEQVETSPSGYKADLGVPVVVLINEDAASASEIFAGCMRDYGQATLVGTHSYGKSSVQHIFPMIDGAASK